MARTRKVKTHNKKLADHHEDKLSKLPDDIIHRILSFLPTQTAVKTSILSKQWTRIWASVPTLDCKVYRDHLDITRERFAEFIDNCLKHRDANASITKLHLQVCFLTPEDAVDRWLSCVSEKTVEVLDLCILPSFVQRHRLPQRFYNARSLTVLKLENLKLDQAIDFRISFPSLKSLFLIDVRRMDDQMLHSILAGSPLLEILILQYCLSLSDPLFTSSGLQVLETTFCSYYCPRTFRVSCSSLKSLSFELEDTSDPVIQVLEAKNLESITYDGAEILDQNIAKFADCSKVKSLSISRVSLRDDDKCLEDLVSGLPLLEALEIKHCRMLRAHLRIRSENLKSLFVRDVYRYDTLESEGDLMVFIDTPNLVSFNLNNAKLLKVSMEAPNLLDSTVVLRRNYFSTAVVDDEWHFRLIEFLSQVGCCKNLKLSCFAHETRDLRFPKKVRENVRAPLPNVKNLEIKVQKLESRKLKTKKSVRWMAPFLETLSVKEEPDYERLQRLDFDR
ncbi:hypothetical protein TIFTF001_015711 [Ficus carica]|uniref:F-box domain-containing protein n=1 Tax=Ficus carica TaxID=3494 RepID=A0AA88A7Q0_FICCA|nr:hypothetical protein TIFTF001_015711 [Ficus carica]